MTPFGICMVRAIPYPYSVLNYSLAFQGLIPSVRDSSLPTHPVDQ